MSGVRAETRMVPPGHGLRFYRDADHHDRNNDAIVSAAFGDDYEYGLPPVHPMRRGYRPSLSSAIGRAIRTAEQEPRS